VLITCWSVKGGVGATVVAASLALATAAAATEGVVLVDLGGDAPHALGLREPDGPGLAEWLRAGPDAPPDALGRLLVPAVARLDVLPRGRGPLTEERVRVLAALLAQDQRSVVVDAGRLDGPEGAPEVAVGRALASAAERSILVVRPCQLGLFRARRLPLEPTAVVVVREPARALSSADVAAVIGAPVVAELAVDPAVARTVDAGLLATRMPRAYAAAMERLA
jgi:hypothetical protein